MRTSILHFCNPVTKAAAAAITVVSANTTPLTPRVAIKELPPEKAQFLANFRQRLNADPDNTNLDVFVGNDEKPSASSVGPIRRGQEPLPQWLKLHIPKGLNHRPKYNQIRRSMREKKLSTVCEEAKCPNIGDCWGGGENGEAATAAIMLMGSTCTRGCRFCSVATSRTPPPLDPKEPEKVASAVSEMGVDYIVLTMVDRDDLPDAGANHVTECIRRIKELSPDMLVEALVGDFNGRTELAEIVGKSGLNVYAHNIETVERLTPNVRDRRASYSQTLKMLEYAATLKSEGIDVITKTSIMLGLGETEYEVRQTLKDLRNVGCSALTLGQYLQPSRSRLKVKRYAHPDEFKMWEQEALAMGYLYCASGPMVRSSYRAGEYYIRSLIRKKQAEAAAGLAGGDAAENERGAEGCCEENNGYSCHT